MVVRLATLNKRPFFLLKYKFLYNIVFYSFTKMVKTVQINDVIHAKAKGIAATNSRKLQEFVEEALVEKMNRCEP